MPIEYLCQRRTNCRKWPGVVKVEPDEIAAIVEFVGLQELEFIERHTRF